MNPDGLDLEEQKKLNDIENIGLMIFTVTPVQSFISKARKLRDYWTGSILLSWLAFEGIRWIIEYLGPDHVLYPSLIDQPLVLEYLKNTWYLDERYIPRLHTCNDIATFPNKVLFLVPLNYAKEIGETIQEHIQNEWEQLANIVIDFIKDRTNCNKDLLKKQFNEQIASYWDISWVTTPLLSNNNKAEYEDLINKKLIEQVNEQVKIFKEVIDYKNEVGKLYPLTNLLAQNALSNLKMSARHIRPEQNGIKCSLCGEMEALTDTPYSGINSAHEYKQNMDTFWQEVRKSLGISDAKKESGELKEHEVLCGVCLVKRFLARALKEKKHSHILTNTFRNYESFPSTTEISLFNYYMRKNIRDNDKTKRNCSTVI
jgi:CRISPR-associated protein Cmr2